VNAFVNDQLSSALDGFAAFADARSTVVADLAEARKNLDELVKDKAPANEIAAAKKEVADLNAALAALPITAEGALGIGASLAAMFAEGLRQGRPVIELLREIGPVAEQYAEHFAMAGVTGGEAFETLRRLAGIASDEITGPAVAAISGLEQALVGMHNSGLMNQEMFTGITSQLVALRGGLTKAGVSADDSLSIMQHGLQKAWELWKDHNYVVDDATRALLEEAEAAGKVGDEHRTAQDKMLIATEQMRDAVLLLAEALGVTLPANLKAAADAARNMGRDTGGIFDGLKDKVGDLGDKLGDLPDRIDIDVNFNPGDMPRIQPDVPNGGDYPQHDAGAFVRRDHVAMVHSGEMIGPVSFMSQALKGALAQGGRTSGGDIIFGERSIVVEVPEGTRNPNEFGRQVARSFFAELETSGEARANMRGFVLRTARDAGFRRA
jgi:hypothetical protein